MAERPSREFVIGIGVRKLLPQLGLSEDEVLRALEGASFAKGAGDRWYADCVWENKSICAECHVGNDGRWHVVFVFER